MNFKWQIVIVVVLLLESFFVIAASPATSAPQLYPLRPLPVARANDLEGAERTLHLALGAALHDAQEAELVEARSAIADPADRQAHFLAGLMLALEEYYQMELSYPDSVKLLLDSGYYCEEWNTTGINLVDFCQDRVYSSVQLTLVYVPQPIGSVDIIRVPGGGCSQTMRSYGVYSILAPEDQSANWELLQAPPGKTWVSEFLELGYRELIYMDQKSPGNTRCPSCT